MIKLKFILKKKTTYKKICTLVSSSSNKSTKYDTSTYLGIFNSSLNLSLFKYLNIIRLSKKSITYSKQYPVLITYYLKQHLSKNLN